MEHSNHISRFVVATILAAAFVVSVRAANIEPPPDPGFEASTLASDVIADVEIVSGGPFRAVALLKKAIKGDAPKIFEIEGFNSFNWDTVHHGLPTGTRCILFLSKTERPDVFATLTPAAPRFNLTPEGAMVAFGDPPVRVPVKPAALEEGLALLLERNASGKSPEGADKFLRGLWEQSEVEARYLAVELAGALRDPRALPLVLEASKDKLLKLRLRAVEALGKIGSPEALSALQALLKDDKKSVAREAARALALSHDAASVPALLEWVRKNAGEKGSSSVGSSSKSSSSDADRAKVEAIAMEILSLARATGAFNDSEKLSRALLDIARLPNDRLAGEALSVAAAVAPVAVVPTLIELVLDRTYEQRDRALGELQHIALKPVRNVEDFQAWWKEAGKKYSEDARRDAVESAVRKLAGSEDFDERRKCLETIRNAPGAIGVISASPLLVKTKESALFTEDDFAAWNTPLAVPFLIERLGRENASQRRAAFECLISLCQRNPRLNPAIWPLLRAHLAERDAAIRRSAETAVAALSRTDSVDVLIDALGARSTLEQQESAQALFAMSARSFGFSLNEPVPDQLMAREHLRGWWDGAKEKFRPLALTTPLNPFALFPNESGKVRVFETLPDTERAKNLEKLALAEDSDTSETAFRILWSERAPTDPFWAKLLSQGRLRDRVRGRLGAMGNPAGVDALRKSLTQYGTEKGGEVPPILFAHSLLALTSANLPPENSAENAKSVVAWLKGPGEKAALPLKRLAVLSLGLVDKEPASLAFLTRAVEDALKVGPPDVDALRPDDIENDYALMRSALIALSARSDSNDALVTLLAESGEARIRENAGRALSLRRERAAIPGIANALEKSDRFSWLDLAHLLQPLVKQTDIQILLDLLDNSKNTARAAAVWVLSRNAELGNDPRTRAKLIAAMADDSSLVRYYAAESLGKRHAKSALDTLIKALDDTDDEVRAAAAQAIGEIGDPDACEAVVKAAPLQYRIDARWMKALAIAESVKYAEMILKFANSNMYMEQRAGMEALSASGMAAAKERLMKAFRSDEEPLQTLAADLLVQRGDGLLPMITEDLASKDKSIRARAYHVLSRLKTAKSQATLEQAFKTEDDQNLKTLIGWALSRAAN